MCAHAHMLNEEERAISREVALMALDNRLECAERLENWEMCDRAWWLVLDLCMGHITPAEALRRLEEV
jgi:hypothetical protein